MKVYEIDYLGQKMIVGTIKEVTEMVEAEVGSEENKDGDKFIIRQKGMSKWEFDALPEFQGY